MKSLQCTLVAIVMGVVSTVTRADLVLETETAQLGKKGTLGISAAVQVERDRDGSTRVLTLNQFEYAVTDRAEILIEPFFYEYDNPHNDRDFSGLGDLEITPSYMVLGEQEYFPAIVLSFKLKVPTASNRNIGTGEFDYYPFIIIGKTYGQWTFNANFGYNFITSPPTEKLRNQFIYDFSAEYAVNTRLSLFAECFGNTRASADEKSTFAGAFAAEYKFTERFSVFASIGYDTHDTTAFRMGFNFDF